MPGGGLSLRRDRSASPSKKSATPFRIAQEMMNNSEDSNQIFTLQNNHNNQQKQQQQRNQNYEANTSSASSFPTRRFSQSFGKQTTKEIEAERYRTASRNAAQQIRARFANENNNNNTDNTDNDGFAVPTRRSFSAHHHHHHGHNHNHHHHHHFHNFRSNQSSQSRSRYNTRAPGQPVFNGLLSAPCSPFDPVTGRCDSSVIREYAELHRRDGVNGVFCNGTTGESMSLTVRERMANCAAWVETGLQVCVHIGCQSLLDTQKLARHAQDSGADGIAVMVPATIAKAQSLDYYVDYLFEVYKAAPEIPMLVYHFPTLTGHPYKLYDILQKGIERIPSLCGAKFTSWDLADYAACQSIGGQITDIIYSIEGNLVGAAFLGARTFVGMQFSMIAPIYRRIVDAARAGDNDKAQRENQRASDFMLKMSQCGGNSIEKCVAITKFVTAYRLRRDIGEPRPPGARLSDDEKDKVRRLLFPFFDRVDSNNTTRRNDESASGIVLAPTSCFRRHSMRNQFHPARNNNNNYNNNHTSDTVCEDKNDQIFRASINLKELEATYSPSSAARRRSINTLVNDDEEVDHEDEEDYDSTRSPRFSSNNNNNNKFRQSEGHDSQSKYKLIM